MPEKNTDELQGELMKTRDVAVFLQENKAALQVKTLPEYLSALLEEKGMTKKEAVHASGIERTYAYHKIAVEKNPQRPKL